MSELKIPEAAYTAGANAYDEADPDSRWLEAIDAAAPLIVAAELRRLAETLSIRAREMRDEDDRNIRSSGLSVGIIHLRARADELDPQGVAK